MTRMPRGQIAARLCPRRQVEPAVVCLEEQLDQQGAEQAQHPKRVFSKSRKDMGPGSRKQ